MLILRAAKRQVPMNTWSSPCTMSPQNRRPRSSIKRPTDQLMRRSECPEAVSRMSASVRSGKPARRRSADPIDPWDDDVRILLLAKSRSRRNASGTKVVVSIVEEHKHPGGFGRARLRPALGPPVFGCWKILMFDRCPAAPSDTARCHRSNHHRQQDLDQMCRQGLGLSASRACRATERSYRWR